MSDRKGHVGFNLAPWSRFGNEGSGDALLARDNTTVERPAVGWALPPWGYGRNELDKVGLGFLGDCWLNETGNLQCEQHGEQEIWSGKKTLPPATLKPQLVQSEWSASWLRCAVKVVAAGAATYLVAKVVTKTKTMNNRPKRARKNSEDMKRANVIARIKKALKSRSGKAWSVTGGSGTSYGWLTIDAPPKQRTWRHRATKPGGYEYEEYDSGQPGGHSSPSDRKELAALLGLASIHHQGESVPASHDHYRAYIDRAEGRVPAKIPQDYWD